MPHMKVQSEPYGNNAHAVLDHYSPLRQKFLLNFAFKIELEGALFSETQRPLRSKFVRLLLKYTFEVITAVVKTIRRESEDSIKCISSKRV